MNNGNGSSFDNLLSAKWNQIKGEIKQQWGDLTDDEIDRARGNRDELVGILQEKYGKSEAQAEREVDEFLGALSEQRQSGDVSH